MTCDDGLLEELVRVARTEIQRSLPALVPFSEPLPAGFSLHKIPTDASLELILNCAAAVLYLDPSGYAQWEPSALAECQRISELALTRRAPVAVFGVAQSLDQSSGNHRTGTVRV